MRVYCTSMYPIKWNRDNGFLLSGFYYFIGYILYTILYFRKIDMYNQLRTRVIILRDVFRTAQLVKALRRRVMWTKIKVF